jgi:predicted nicotinamide N-methyase
VPSPAPPGADIAPKVQNEGHDRNIPGEMPDSHPVPGDPAPNRLRLGGRTFAVFEELVSVGEREVRITRPRDPEELLDEKAFEADEFLPYWAELWPSGLALARELAAHDLKGKRVLELGCGLGLAGVAAALEGADVVASDWSEEALAFAALNARRNGAFLGTLRCSWASAAPFLDHGSWDLVLAADVLYERRDVPALSRLLQGLGSDALVATPERPAVPEFLESVALTHEVEELQRPLSGSVVVYRLVKRANP